MVAVRAWPPPPDAATDRPESGEARTERVIARLRIVVGAVIVAVAALTVVESWDDVRGTLDLMEPLDLLESELLVLLGLGLSVLDLAAVGSARSDPPSEFPTASRIYLLGQLGKYLPGSVWALLAQAELGRAVGVPGRAGSPRA